MMANVRGPHLTDDACAELVLGLTTGDARALAVAHARTCRDCEDRLRAHAGANVRARADLTQGAGMFVVAAPAPKRARVSRAWVGLFGAAAAITVAIAMRSPAPPGAAQVPWLTRPGDLVRVRGDQPLDDALRSGFEAYARHDLNAAIAALEKASATGGAEQARRLYLGHALLASGRAAEARAVLGSVDRAVLPEPWKDEATRALAAAWRATGDPRRADSLERTGAR